MTKLNLYNMQISGASLIKRREKKRKKQLRILNEMFSIKVTSHLIGGLLQRHAE